MIPIIGSEYPKIVIPLLDSAKRNIDIVVYDWRWYENQPGHVVQQFNIALVRAVKRGVLVRAVLNTDLHLDLMKSVGIRARILKDKRTLHTKMILVDDRTLVIGSHNFTRNAFAHNIEASVIVDIPDDVTRFSTFFDNLFGL